MGLSSLTLGLAVALLAAHHLVMNLPALYRRDGVFWSLQLAEVGAGLYVLIIGLPGLEFFPIARWILGVLFLHHAAVNQVSRPKLLAPPAPADRGTLHGRSDEVDVVETAGGGPPASG